MTAGDRYNQLAQRIVDARDKQHGGIVTNFDQLKGVDGVTPAVIASLNSGFSLGTFTIRNVDIVGPKVGAQLRRQAMLATLYALAGHVGIYCLPLRMGLWRRGGDRRFSRRADHPRVLLAFPLRNFADGHCGLADSGWIFDERHDRHLRSGARESSRSMRRESFTEIVNKSINQTLSRTILTSGLTFLTVLVLYLMGGEVLRAFSFAMVVGVVIGTYSSFGIAAPIVVFWNQHWGQGITPAKSIPASSSGVRAGSAAEKRVPATARR